MGGLSDKDWSLIIGAIRSFATIETVVLFGSRAKGTYKKGSDIDLAIKGKDITYETAIQLSDNLNEQQPLLYFFDVIDYAQVNLKLREHIDREGILIYPENKT